MITIPFTEAKKISTWLSNANQNKVDNAFFSRKEFVTLNISQARYEKILSKLRYFDNLQKLLPKCVENNNRGIELESQGSIKEAILIYEENIGLDKYPARHAYDRLLVLYRKNKDYKNEKRIAKIATKVFPSEKKYIERLKRINILIKNAT